MSIIPQNSENEVAIFDCVQKFFASYQVGSLLKRCNGTKEKGFPAISLLRYKPSNIFWLMKWQILPFSRSLCIIMTAMIASLQKLLRPNDEQLEEFTADFEARLPKYLQNAFHHERSAA